jgi:hypothetical protein
MSAKVFEPGTRISAVQHLTDKAQLLRRVIPVAPDIFLGELGIKREKVIHGPRSSEQVCGVPQLRRFNHHRVLELEDVQVSGEDKDQGYQGDDHQRCVVFMGLASLCLRTSNTSSFQEMIASASIGVDRLLSRRAGVPEESSIYIRWGVR